MELNKRNLIISVTIFLLSIIAIGYFSWLINKDKYIFIGFGFDRNQNIIYAQAKANMFAPAVLNALPRMYVPNSLDHTVSVIDPQTYQVINTFKTGKNPQHVVPSYDLKTLWVANDKGNSLTPINPTTGLPSANIAVDDPYNLYFTPDGRSAIVVCEAHKRLDFRDPQTMLLQQSIPIACGGINHMDVSADDRYAVFTCEFSGQLLKLDLTTRKVVGYLSLQLPNVKARSMPQDIRLSPDGRTFYVADMMLDGVFLIDPDSFTQIGFIPTGVGTHSVYPSRDGTLLYVANRGCHHLSCKPHGPGSVSVVDFASRKVIANWPIPGGGSPDMGNVSANGKEFWLSGRYDNEVYVFDTTTGKLMHRIAVGNSPHGLTVWPQPGRYSLGHTGNMR